MDMLVPIMMIGGFLTGCVATLWGAWLLFKRARTRGPAGLLPRFPFSAWNRFWFTPADPTVLALIRICCGAITTYTIFAYTFMLQDFMGKDSWYDLPMRLNQVRSRPNLIGPAMLPIGRDYAEAQASTKDEADYKAAYKKMWGVYPPAPFPRDAEEAENLNIFKQQFGYDLRVFGLSPPRTKAEIDYIPEYMLHPANLLHRPPPAYPANAQEKQEVFDYMAKHSGIDPRLAYAVGQPAWSLWFHVTDPSAMMAIHVLVILVCLLFTLGFCTRVTSALTWMAALWYIHRNPVLMFGVDTMMVILLLYLMIGTSGGALSVDRLIARWWSGAKPGIVNRWRAWFGKPPLRPDEIRPVAYSTAPVPTVATNLAIRLLQVHLCIIYLVSGLTKLQGAAWWNGTAVWGTLANFEFAPMAFEIDHVQIYNELLRWLGGHQLLLEGFLTGACLFTLTFEIGYAFLIWRPGTRWFLLGGAIILHGFIGLLMGLKTFSLMMLVMNMVFLRQEEVARFLNLFKHSAAGSGRGRHDDAVKAVPATHSALPTLKTSAESASVQLKK